MLLPRTRSSHSHKYTAGSFNNWSRLEPMPPSPQAAGVFEATLCIRTVQHTFRFLVDGVEQVDPDLPTVAAAGDPSNILDLTRRPRAAGKTSAAATLVRLVASVVAPLPTVAIELPDIDILPVVGGGGPLHHRVYAPFAPVASELVVNRMRSVALPGRPLEFVV